MFIMGKNEFIIRIPSSSEYASNIKKEYDLLPKFKNFLSFIIPEPIKIAQPSKEFPYHWSIYKYIEGETISSLEEITHMNDFAKDLAKFLNEFQKINTENGLKPSEHNFYRGGDLKVYEDQVQRSLKILYDKIDIKKASNIWNQAIENPWDQIDVWVHGDISLGNALFQNQKLHAIIDFSCIAVGDPSCDLAIAWSDFNKDARKIFYHSLENIDEYT
jgi:aminoglycoside phosphotransferase (APT) family kinase protein